MNPQEKLLTLSEIKDKYPLNREIFIAEDGQKIEAWVVRDEDRAIIYVASKSARFISDSGGKPPQQ